MIRPFLPADAEPFREVVRAVYDEYGFTWEEGGYHSDLYDMERHFDGERGMFWVAEVEGLVVGGGGLELFSALEGERGELQPPESRGLVRIGGADCELVRLYLLKEARGRGLGLALARAIVSGALERNRRLMEIWSDKHFREAHSLYERIGAVRVGERVCNDPDKAEEWGYALRV